MQAGKRAGCQVLQVTKSRNLYDAVRTILEQSIEIRGGNIMKALITGMTGMVGSHLADSLLRETDWEIYGMQRWTILNI